MWQDILSFLVHVQGAIRDSIGADLRGTLDHIWRGSTRQVDVVFGNVRDTGEIADQIRSMFHVFRTKLSFQSLPELDATQFEPPTPKSGQLRLF